MSMVKGRKFLNGYVNIGLKNIIGINYNYYFEIKLMFYMYNKLLVCFIKLIIVIVFKIFNLNKIFVERK